MEKVFSLTEFKDAVKSDRIKILDDIGNNMDKASDNDKFYPEEGIAVIHQKNLMKYLEKFMCKNLNELSDFLYYKKGIFLKVI